MQANSLLALVWNFDDIKSMSQYGVRIFLGLLAGVFFCIGSAWSWSGQKLVVALKPDKNPETMLAEREELKKYFSAQLESEVDVIVPLSAAVIAEGLRNGSIDLAFISATEMFNIRESQAADLLLVNKPAGKTWYESVWLVKADAPYQSIEDLRGKRAAFSSRTSTSGFLIPLRDLHQKGLVQGVGDLEDFFWRGNVIYGTGYVSAVEQVLSGGAEAAAVSDYVFLKDKHLTEDQKNQLRILQAQGPVPSHVIAASNRLSDLERESLRKVLLGLNAPEYESLRNQVFTASLTEVEVEEHLRPVQEALQLTGAIP